MSSLDIADDELAAKIEALRRRRDQGSCLSAASSEDSAERKILGRDCPPVAPASRMPLMTNATRPAKPAETCQQPRVCRAKRSQENDPVVFSLGDPEQPWVPAGEDAEKKKAQLAAQARLRQAAKERANRVAEDEQLYAQLAQKSAERAKKIEERKQQKEAAGRASAEAHKQAMAARAAMEQKVKKVNAQREAAARAQEEAKERAAAEKKLARLEADNRRAEDAEPARLMAKARVSELARERARQAEAQASAKLAEAEARAEALRQRANVRESHLQALEGATMRRQEVIRRREKQGQHPIPDAVKRAAARHNFPTLELVKSKTPAQRDLELRQFLEQQKKKQEARLELVELEADALADASEESPRVYWGADAVS